MITRNGWLQLLMLLAALIAASCGGSTKTTAPPPLANFQPEIINTQDNFQFQATALTDVTTVAAYYWSNTGTRATVNHSSAVSAGTTLLEIFDAANVRVYADSLRASGSDQTSVGTAGLWRVRVTLQQVDGTLNFRAEKL